ncbi:Plasma membrane iron permease [Scedosporium apiospermum]|uniref:Plasma membrane iron permease n=1 Tax=Pseudallescheria apiosperma TaxID=563466 RepID=A0A084GGS1_PSEDA|nr:Plasma membrane iron permease [Scedosporium apiospermum]KEZ46533.1 Plasma membrane iron permease [Scedosporium apiospermum]
MAGSLFSVPIFLVVFRETLETAIIVSVLLAFLKQTLDRPGQDGKIYNAFRRQVWLGTAVGFSICMTIAAGIIGIFYGFGKDAWQDQEYYYEGIFSLISSVVITVMGVALLRVGRMQEKWRSKLATAIEAPLSANVGQPLIKRVFEKYSMFLLPFITILREGIEGIVFVAGVSFSAPVSAIPLAVLAGFLLGAAIGYAVYK